MRYDHFSLLPERAFQKRAFGGMTLEGGGGGGPTETKVENTSIPEYARPYVESMLGATQQQLFYTQPSSGGGGLFDGLFGGGSGSMDITGIKPYVPYSQDPTAYVAGFSPLQQQSFQGAANLQMPGQFGAATGATAEATQRALQAGYQPGYFGNQFRAPGQYASGLFSMLEAQAPELQQYQMGPAERVGTQTFAQPGSAEAYMSPYMQNVVDVQQREARRASEIARQGQQAQAVGAGAFGGTRQALVEAERQRNLATQLGDIQATGQQAAYQQAQQQFNQEQQARLQAALANQQAGITVGGQNLGALLGVQQLGAGQGLQAQLANQQALQAAQQAAEQSRQYGYGQAMTAAQQRAQYGLAGQQLGEQSRQFGAGYGLQGLGMGLQGAGQLAGIGSQELGAQQNILGLQQQYGALQQQQQQNIINQAIQNYAMAQQYPQQQLSFMNAMLRGLPLQTSTIQSYQAAPSMYSQLGGIGAGIYGLSKAGAFKEGGEVKGYAEGGITKLSRDILLNPTKYSEASIKRLMAENAVDETVGLPALRTIELERNKQQMAQTMAAPQQPSVKNQIIGQTQGGVGIDEAPVSEDMFTAAGGGIVAFAGEEGSYVLSDQDKQQIAKEETEMAAGLRTDYSPQIKTILQAPSKQKNLEYKQKEQAQQLERARSLVPPGFARTAAPAGIAASPAVAPPAPPVDVAAPYADEGSRGSAKSILSGAIPSRPFIPQKAAEEAPAKVKEEAAVAPAAAKEEPTLSKFLEERRSLMPKGKAYEGLEESIKGDKEKSKAERESNAWMRFAEAGFGAAAGTSRFALANFGKAAADAMKGYAEDLKEQKKLDREDRKILAEIEKARRDEERGDVDKATDRLNKVLENMSNERRTQITADASIKAHQITASAARQPAAEVQLYNLWASQQPPGADRSLARFKREMGEATAEAKDPLLAGLRERLQGGKGGITLSESDTALLNKYLTR